MSEAVLEKTDKQKPRRRRNRKRLPETIIEANIESLSDEGRGIAHVDERTVFVSQALAGETVRFQYTRYTKKLTEAKTVAVIEASDDRVEPACAAFIACGGCSLQHMSHAAQLQLKQDALIAQLERTGKVQPAEILPPLTGPIWQYRHKARLGVRYVAKKQKVLVGFRERGSSFITETQRCEVLHDSVGGIIEQLSALIGELDAKQTIPQIEVAVGDDTTVLVFRHLQELSEHDREALTDFAQQRQLTVLLQAGKPDQLEALYPATPDKLFYLIDDASIRIEFQPSDFIQVNPALNRSMLTQAIGLMQLQADDKVLDLFSGLGNFSLPMAKRCTSVVGVEGSAVMVKKARSNAGLNGIDNVSFVCADLYSDEITYAPWLKQQFNKVLLDPPRSGAAEIIPLLVKNRPERIVYVSCHPATLARDAGILVNEFGYKLLQAGIMDMFPHTAHVESIAVFEKQ
jgi:23S rRNA (uracil1939-C5)-methyltransferase